ncbi:MAG: hypothetical protein MMC33_002457 [Icmadophila ericetorum]|nr:hypothetical protein [Icmadophila ericetorum]
MGVDIEESRQDETESPSGDLHDHEIPIKVPSQRPAAGPHGGSGIVSNRLVDESGKQRYANGEYWTNLCHELEDLKRLEHVWSVEEEKATESDTSYRSISSTERPPYDAGFLFSLSSVKSDLLAFHPTQGQMFLLWQIYLENVDPLLKIFHRPAVQKIILDRSRDIRSVSRETECLLFAINYAAVMSMQQDECKTLMSNEKTILACKYRFATEQALARVGLLETRDLTVLQAFVLFLICAKQDGMESAVWTLTSLAIRIAYRLGLNRDPMELENCPPYETEMRRRLWWHICVMDTLTAQASGCDPSIFQQTFNTRFPSNLNDSDLDRSMSGMPAEHQGRTEMLFCLVRFESSYALRKSVFSEKFSKDNLYPIMTLEEKIKYMDNLEEQLENKYLRYCDMTIPLSFVTATYARLLVTKVKLVIRRMLDKRSPSNPAKITEYVFTKAVDVVEHAYSLTSVCGLKKWVWLFGTFLEREVLAFVLGSLCLNTKGQAVDRAWRIVNKIFADAEEAPSGEKMKRLQKQIIKLLAKARAARKNAIQQRLKASCPNLLAVDKSTSLANTENSDPQADPFAPAPPVPDSIRQSVTRRDDHTPQDIVTQDIPMSDQTTSTSIANSAPQSNFPVLSLSQKETLTWATWDSLLQDFDMDAHRNGDGMADLSAEMGGDLGLGELGDWNPGLW